MLLIVLVVLFVMVMFLWLLALLGAAQPSPNPMAVQAVGWLPWFACLFLGITVFLVGSGVVVWK